jgi:PAS domain S-box-containing protein
VRRRRSRRVDWEHTMSTENIPDSCARVLLVDDDPVMRMLASAALRAIGFETREVCDGREALEQLDAFRPDLVVLDVEMPGMDGFETCTRIRERAGERLAVLMVTGNGDSATIDRAFDVGASDFIHKPIDWRLMRHRVRFLMRAHDAFAGLRASERRLANAQRLARVGHWEWDPEADVMLWSDEVWRILGRTPSADVVRLSDLLETLPGEDRAAVEKAMRLSEENGEAWTLDHSVVTPAGETRVVRQQGEIVRAPTGAVELVAGTIQDITERRRAEEQIRYLAYYDSLTSLPNRRMLLEHLQRCLAAAAAESRGVAILHLDLDRFKRVNDSLGHGIGDEVLRAVAARLLGCVRAGDFVAQTPLETARGVPGASVSRVAGDEFTIVLSHIRSQEHTTLVARRILEAMRSPIIVGAHLLSIEASIGIAVSPGDGAEAEALLQNAGAATAEAKNDGGATYRFFNAAMNAGALRVLQVETELRGALERGELVLHYQPQWDGETGEIVGAEALVRWPHCPLGPISPGEFIPIAEDTGLIGAIGEFTLRTACDQVQSWRRAGVPPVRVSVNFSSRQIQQLSVVADVARVLADSGVDRSLIELEVTETAMLSEGRHVQEVLVGLKQLGVSLALDDFGVGFSSLSHVARLPIDVLKIDQSFVKGIDCDANARAIVAAVIAMARRLSLRTVAEGVETEIQERFLVAEGCDTLQGFRVAPALEPDAFVALLNARRRAA